MGLVIGATCPNAAAADYFPLNVGNCWVYSPSYGKGYRIDSIVGTETVGQTPAYIWKRLEAPPDNYHERRWLYKDGLTLKAVQFWGNEMEPPLSDPIVLDPPWSLENVYSPTVGNTWQIELTVGSTVYVASFLIESITDTVTVPAGRFNGCIRIRQLGEITTEDVTEKEYKRYWLAPDVGPVRYVKYGKNWKGVKKDQKLVGYSLE